MKWLAGCLACFSAAVCEVVCFAFLIVNAKIFKMDLYIIPSNRMDRRARSTGERNDSNAVVLFFFERI